MKLALKNFRSHKKLEIEIAPTTLIVGQNGVGKTNILEAISFISAARSFRVEDKKNLIRTDADFMQIILDDLSVIVSRKPRLIATFKVAGAKRSLGSFIGLLPSVIFTPESLSIVNGSPADRRRFFDQLLSQSSREYFLALLKYKKILIRRNRLLSSIATGQAGIDELDFWDQELLEAATIIVSERAALSEFLNQRVREIYLLISNKKEELKINYKPQLSPVTIEKIREKQRIEIAAETTIFGPHRDNLEFILSGREAENYASRGEIRTIVLSLKIAELDFLDRIIKKAEKETVIDRPLLLLDDIFSELDHNHRRQIIQLIAEYPTIITATDAKEIKADLTKKAKIIELN
jgi:DNA replication and repair protein RecF